MYFKCYFHWLWHQLLLNIVFHCLLPLLPLFSLSYLHQHQPNGLSSFYLCLNPKISITLQSYSHSSFLPFLDLTLYILPSTALTLLTSFLTSAAFSLVHAGRGSRGPGRGTSVRRSTTTTCSRHTKLLSHPSLLFLSLLMIFFPYHPILSLSVPSHYSPCSVVPSSLFLSLLVSFCPILFLAFPSYIFSFYLRHFFPFLPPSIPSNKLMPFPATSHALLCLPIPYCPSVFLPVASCAVLFPPIPSYSFHSLSNPFRHFPYFIMSSLPFQPHPIPSCS